MRYREFDFVAHLLGRRAGAARGRLSALMTDTVSSAATVTFPDGAADAPAKHLKAEISPVQDLHGYSKPWPAGVYKNLFSETVVTGTYVDEGDNAGEYDSSVNQVCSAPDHPVPVVAGTTYFFHVTGASYRISRIFWYDADDNHISNKSLVSNDLSAEAPADAAFLRFRFNTAFGNNASAYGSDADHLACVSVSDESFNGNYAPYANVCPIEGWDEVKISVSGINLWDEEWEVGSYNADGTEYPSTARIRTQNYIPVKPSTTYYFHTNGATADVHYYDKSKAHISLDQKTDATFTTPSDCYFVRFCMSVAYGTTYGDNLSINYPSTDTSYHAYKGALYSVQLGELVYGGEIDATTGELTIKQIAVDMGSLEWTAAGNDIYKAPYDASVIDDTGNGIKFISSAYKAQYVAIASLANGCGRLLSNYLSIKDTTYGNDADAFTAGVSGQIIVFTLTTDAQETKHTDPVRIETVYGDNVVYADSGNAAIEYYCDTEKYIEKKLAEA